MRGYSDEVLREGILRDYQTMSFKNIGLKYKAGEKRVREMAKILGVKKDLRLIWNDESEQYLKDTFSDTNSEEIAKVLGFTVSSICAKASKLNLKKSKEFLSNNNKASWKKGHKTWNKGMKGLRFEGSEKGYFKKGSKPTNTKELHSSSFRKDKDGKVHEFIKISDRNWKLKKHLVWEQYYGEIPKDMCIRTKDGNSLNTDISNLELVSRKDNRIMNSGCTSLTDKYIARRLAPKDNNLMEKILENKDLIELQRTIYKANRICNQQSQPK